MTCPRGRGGGHSGGAHRDLNLKNEGGKEEPHY